MPRSITATHKENSPLSSALALTALLTLASSPAAKLPVYQPAAHCCTATIRVRVPEGTGTLYLAGSLPQLGLWRPDGLALTGSGRERPTPPLPNFRPVPWTRCSRTCPS